MAQNVYECLFILDSNRYARDPNAASAQVDKLVESCGGKSLVSRLWSEQKLAYPIGGQRKGSYWLTYFELESEKVADFNRQCNLSELVVRNMTLKVDPRLVDTLVSHAKGESQEPEEAVSEEAPKEASKPAEAAPDKAATPDEAATDESAGKDAET